MHNLTNLMLAADAARDPFFGLTKLDALLYSGTFALAAVNGVYEAWRAHRRGRLRPEVITAIHTPQVIPFGVLLGLIVGHWRWALFASVVALVVELAAGLWMHREDQRAGGDRRRRAQGRLGFIGVIRGRWITRVGSMIQPRRDEVIVGATRTRVVKLTRGWESGRHTGVFGAPGSGKSTTIATLLDQHVRGTDGQRHGAVIIDPKGDPAIRRAARAAAEAAGAPYVEFTPQGSVVYDVLAGGDVDRRTDKILAAEEWTEPHYLAGATTYLREVMRTLQATDTPPTLTKVLALMDPDRHENAAASAGRDYSQQLGNYIKSLTPRQRGDLSGLRDRIAALGRSDMAAWLDPDRSPDARRLNLGHAVEQRAVVLFTLQADDYPMLSKKLAAAIVLDLIAVAQRHQANPMPTFVAIDEFGAIDSDLVLRLLARARAAGFSVALAAQALADFTATSPEMATRVIGNLNALIVGRLNDATEAETIATAVGTQDSWTTTQQTSRIAPTGDGTRTLDRDFRIHPDQIKTLHRGQAAVIALDPIRGQSRVEITNVRPPAYQTNNNPNH